MPEVLGLAKELNLKLVENAPEAFGASVEKRIVGSFGNAACFSFYGNKTITRGEGDAVLSRDPNVSGIYWHVCQVIATDLTTFDSGPGLLCFQHPISVSLLPRTLLIRTICWQIAKRFYRILLESESREPFLVNR